METKWYQKPAILWSLITVMFSSLVYFIALVNSYSPEINRLRLENIIQDSVIAYQKIEILRLEANIKANDNNIENAYDLFFDYNKRIKVLEGN